MPGAKLKVAPGGVKTGADIDAVPNSSIVALISSMLAASGLTSGGKLLQLRVPNKNSSDATAQENNDAMRDLPLGEERSIVKTSKNVRNHSDDGIVTDEVPEMSA